MSYFITTQLRTALKEKIYKSPIHAAQEEEIMLKNLRVSHKIKRQLLTTACRPLLWSSGQSFWLQIHRSRVRFPALPYFLRSRGSGTVSTQLREDN
jgi:hypothetical protein